ncbi:hypothetical protein ACNARJ_26815, partial [Klebsiella pneumoniae]
MGKRSSSVLNYPLVDKVQIFPVDKYRDSLQFLFSLSLWVGKNGTVAKLAMRQPFVLFKGLTFQKLCLPGAFRPGDHHNK